MSNYRVLVVDDEAPARKKLVRFLQNSAYHLSVSETGSPQEAMQMIRQSDLVFLDIRMPEMDAFALIKSVGVDNCPPIVFSTAYHRYAIKAFEINAVDYLLKPYDFDRFALALDRAIAGIDDLSRNHEILKKLLKKIPEPEPPQDIWIKHQHKMVPVRLDDITHFESDGNYVKVYCESKKYLLRNSLKSLEAKLDPQHFIRVHRTILLNRNWLLEVRPRSHGDMTGFLKNGKRVFISRRYKDRLI